MGGSGSGRPGWKRKAEHFRSLDVNKMHRAGVLKAGYYGGWQWTVDGEKVASIGLRAECGRLVLFYTIQPYGQERRSIEEPVTLDSSDCRYGGTRPWFICPAYRNGRFCGRRVGKLYLGNLYFVCRHCMRISYASQSEEPMHRHIRRADKIRMSLGGEPGTASLPPRKPKGMHWRTYWRKMDAIDAADAAGDAAFAYWVYRRFPGMKLDDLIG